MHGVDPYLAGLSRVVCTGDAINEAAWTRAETSGDFVGTCRRCGGYLVPDTPTPRPGDPAMAWYVARCVTCNQESAAPDGRVMRRSGRASERPSTR